MENNGYYLDLFTNSMKQYFNEVLIHKNCVSIGFRKYILKNGEDAEFSLQIKPPIFSKDCDEQLLKPDLNSVFFTDKDCKKLLNYSQLWPLHLADASIKGSRLILKLNQPQTLFRVLNSILNEKNRYGVNFTIAQAVTINLSESNTEDLSQLRLALLKRTIDNIMNAVQTKESYDRNNAVEFWLTTKSTTCSKGTIQCGVVLNAAKGTKETEITAKDYYNIQLNDLRIMSEHKYSGPGNEGFLRDLADACVAMSLLEVNPKHPVSLRLDSDLRTQRSTMSKGAAFVLYNCARIASIRKKFQEKCDKGVYPNVPSFEFIDFSLLREKEEWYILFNYLLEYPTMIRKITEDLPKGILGIYGLCRFLCGLSSLFSVYYRRVQILLEPKAHLLPLIYARIQLLTAVEQVMHNALSLLSIKIIEKM